MLVQHSYIEIKFSALVGFNFNLFPDFLEGNEYLPTSGPLISNFAEISNSAVLLFFYSFLLDRNTSRHNCTFEVTN